MTAPRPTLPLRPWSPRTDHRLIKNLRNMEAHAVADLYELVYETLPSSQRKWIDTL